MKILIQKKKNLFFFCSHILKRKFSYTEKNRVISSTSAFEGRKSCTSSKINRAFVSVFSEKPLVECLVCFKKFSVLFTEDQPADCFSKFEVLYVNSADEIGDDKTY